MPNFKYTLNKKQAQVFIPKVIAYEEKIKNGTMTAKVPTARVCKQGCQDAINGSCKHAGEHGYFKVPLKGWSHSLAAESNLVFHGDELILEGDEEDEYIMKPMVIEYYDSNPQLHSLPVSVVLHHTYCYLCKEKRKFFFNKQERVSKLLVPHMEKSKESRAEVPAPSVAATSNDIKEMRETLKSTLATARSTTAITAQTAKRLAQLDKQPDERLAPAPATNSDLEDNLHRFSAMTARIVQQEK